VASRSTSETDQTLPAGALEALDEATRAIAGVLDLDAVLQLIVDRVAGLVDARYAALGIVDRFGVIERFLTFGITAEERAILGPPPQGHGLLGLIIREGRSYRIPDIAAHPDSYGFPPHHPPMRSLLGVPVSVQGRPIGNLYLTDKMGVDEFTAADQQLVEPVLPSTRPSRSRTRACTSRSSASSWSRSATDRAGAARRDHPEPVCGHPVARGGDRRHDRRSGRRPRRTSTARSTPSTLDPRHPELLCSACARTSSSRPTWSAGIAALADELRFNAMVDVDVDLDEAAEAAGALSDGGRTQLLQITREAPQQCRPPRPGRHERRSGSAWKGTALCCASEDNGRGFDPPLWAAASTWDSAICATEQRTWAASWRSTARPAGAPYHRARSPLHGRISHVSDPAPSVMRLLVVDDHEVVRQGLGRPARSAEGFQVVAEAGTVAEAIEAARRFEPDIVVMDVRLPDGSGIEACREIRADHPETRVVMLTSYPDEEAVLSAIVAGASGYLLKQIRARDLVAALEAVGRGESLLDPAVTEKVLERIRRIATGTYTDELAQLTSQEQKILLLVAEGKTNKEIAAEVFLSDKTVKNYVSSILSKLNLERRAQAAAFVAKHRLDTGR
jgi:DNA-binding NarL/FixJ family response regulator